MVRVSYSGETLNYIISIKKILKKTEVLTADDSDYIGNIILSYRITQYYCFP